MLVFFGSLTVDLTLLPLFVSIVESVTLNAFMPAHVALVNEKLSFLKSSTDMDLSFPRVDADSLRPLTYCDDGFANRSDESL